MKIIKTFSFLDESGVLAPYDATSRNIYGIGLLKHTNPIQLVERIHPIYEGLVAALKKDETRVEFSFKSTTASSVNYDLALLTEVLEDFDWEFNCLYFDTADHNYKSPINPGQRWEFYVSWTKRLIKNNLWSNEETVLVADYQKRPRASRKKFEFIALDVPQVYNVLQTESHGVLLVQAADLLLGGFLYSIRETKGDKERNKVRIMEKVLEIQKKVGRKKFNTWKVDWSKSSRSGRV